MSYVVFARKYRPQKFDDIVGQPHITTTLKNAISSGRTAHAYLFAGPRGVGKTTTARIFAKALNCEKGPSPEPCNTCASCKEISAGSSFDILEIDGASNRGIDEIRNLRENVKFAPSKGRFKIYIIDEIHMLTSEAFNALLKTLEEPPQHVKFIFATTSANKVPPTILSRCQRFDFRRIRTKDIIENLKAIAKREKIAAKDEAVALIAKYSEGAMRDAQVMLDQIASFSGGKIDADDVSKILGLVRDDMLFALSGFIRSADAAGAINLIDKIVADGKDLFGVVSALIEHFRNIAVIKLAKDPSDLIDADDESMTGYKKQAEEFTAEEILYVIYTLSSTIDFMRKVPQARIPLEAAMIKLTRPGAFISLDEISEKLKGLGKDFTRTAALSVPAKDAVKTDHAVKRAEPAAQEKKDEKAPVKNPRPGDGQPSVDTEEILSAWNNIIKYVMTKKTFIAYYLQEGYPSEVENNILKIGFPKESKFHKETLESQENKALIEDAVETVLHHKLKVVMVIADDNPVSKKDSNASIGRSSSSEDEEQYESMSSEVDPIVKAAVDIFGGDVVKNGSSKKRS